MGGFKSVFVLLVLLSIIPAVTALSIDKEDGSSIVIHTLEGSGLHIVEVPEDASFAVKGALYLRNENTLTLSVGSLEKAVVVYETIENKEPDNFIYYSFGVLAVLGCLVLLRKAWLPIIIICTIVLLSLSVFSADCEKTVIDSAIQFSCNSSEYVNVIVNIVLKDYNSRSDAVLLNQELIMMDQDFIKKFSERITEPGMKTQVHDYLRAVKQGFIVSEEQKQALAEGKISYQDFIQSL